ncbi:MAG: hypothetical protein QW086_06955 [Pyrobaculum sp.]
MEKKNRRTIIKIEIYRNKRNLNRKLVLIKARKYRKTIMKSLPKSKIKIYISRLMASKDVKRVSILEIVGTRIKINRELTAAGWLFFPTYKLAIGVVLLGKTGVAASAKIPGRTAYFIPINAPITQLLDVDVKDFY